MGSASNTDDRMEHGSPPPRFSENGNPSPRFTEHFNTSPPYQFQNFDGENAPIPAYDPPEHPVHRLSNKDRPLSPSEITSPMPQSYQRDDEEKEVALPPVQPAPYQPPTGERSTRKRICGIPMVIFWSVIAAIVILAIALGVGLGVGLSRNKSSSNSGNSRTTDNTYSIGGVIDPKYYSTQGAFNGSGIALAQQSFSKDLQQGTQGTLVMYFQHYTGQIRWKQLSTQGQWLGGDISQVVAIDAKNSTPLSAVSYVSNGSSTWHVFYISQNNTLKQRTNSNTTNIWVDGPINKLNLQAFDADMVGMQACWYGNDYGDSDYTHSPLPGGNGTTVDSTGDVGMHMWYASDNRTFQQLGWRDGDTDWEHQGEFNNKNGHAGVACYSWGGTTTTYVMFVNLENTAEIWWRDTATNQTSTQSHPINQWTNTSIAINNVYPASSLGYTNAFYAQDKDSLLFNGYNITWAAENTTIQSGSKFTVGGQTPLPGSHLSVSTLPNTSGGDDLIVFYQTNGSDISEYTRDLVAGQWSSVAITIPA